MPLFPVFVDLSEKNVLVVGGGKVATRKVQNLLVFTKKITVVAPSIRKELRALIKENRLSLRRRKFLASDLKNKDVVIVAVDDLKLQERIFTLCEKRKILCNSVDSPKFCNFIFPSLIVRDELVVGISTGGKAPALSKRIREFIEGCLPENVEAVLKKLAQEREKLPKGEKRQKYISELTEKLLPMKR